MRVFAPAVLGVRVHPPAATEATQVPAPSLTETLPVGVPAVDVTEKVTAIPWPVTDGFGVWSVIVVVVLAGFTVWPTPGEVRAAKWASPPSLAVRVLAPAVVGVRFHVPAATLAPQLPVPSLTVTVPVGVPPVEVTLTPTDTACPTTEGFGECVVIAVAVAPRLTVWASPPDTLPAKFALPA